MTFWMVDVFVKPSPSVVAETWAVEAESPATAAAIAERHGGDVYRVAYVPLDPGSDLNPFAFDCRIPHGAEQPLRLEV